MAACSRRRSHALLPVFGSARASSSRLSSTTIMLAGSSAVDGDDDEDVPIAELIRPMAVPHSPPL